MTGPVKNWSAPLRQVSQSAEWQLLFVATWRASRTLAVTWWLLVGLRAMLPAALAVVTGVLVDAVRGQGSVSAPLIGLAVVFVVLQTLSPVHAEVGYNLGAATSAWLQDRLMTSAVRPAGIAHLERPDVMDDFTLARDFDLHLTGPALSTGMSFIGNGLALFGAGVASAAVLASYQWWAAVLVLGAWLSPRLLLRGGVLWHDWQSDEVKEHQRHAEYLYRVAVDAPAAKEVRLFGLASWVVDTFALHRRRLLERSLEAIRLRQRRVLWAALIVVAANALVFWSLARSASQGSLGLGELLVYAGTAIGVSSVAILEHDWWLASAARPIPVVLGIERRMAAVGSLQSGSRSARPPVPEREICFRNVRFRYDTAESAVLDGLSLTIPAGSSMAIVGQNGAGKTTLIKLLTRLYDPQDGRIEVDGVDLRSLDLMQWRSRVAAVFQDFTRYEQSLRNNIAPAGAPDDVIASALERAGAAGLADLDTVLSRSYDGGIELSGGQWQRIALARALCGVQMGAGVVILDEPTAQLDVRGETEIFDRILAATRTCTTILISHRFSTVRHADQICVLEHGRVVELGTHHELMQHGGRYRTMFDLQAARFAAECHEK